MRKIINLLIILVLASSFVLAQQGIHEPGTGIENPELKEAGQGTGQGLENGEPVLISNQEQNQGIDTQLQNRIMTEEGLGEQERQRLQTGLENALTKVKNENARAMLQRNLERWMEKYQQRFQKMENIEIEGVDEETGEATIKAQEPVKYFGFIQGKATKRFTMDKNGNINERAPWYSIFYSEEE
ncbi:hypothetical protein KY306_02425 [Candidatus Woesearchaeota archaeon]|nr:hypothetical protein [Candidatus Woesearchaeota archaeon]